MSYFRNIFFKFIKKDKPILGRWSINYNEHHLNQKIYLANHDNCGPCGSINPPKKNLNTIINERKKSL